MVNGAAAVRDFGQEQWIKLYFKLRVLEENIDISGTATNSILTSILARSRENNSIDMTLAAAYADVEVKRRMNVEV